eukprot:48164-Prorocentrum_minimum.AAC.2
MVCVQLLTYIVSGCGSSTQGDGVGPSYTRPESAEEEVNGVPEKAEFTNRGLPEIPLLDQNVARLDDQILRVEELVLNVQESVQTVQAFLIYSEQSSSCLPFIVKDE